MKGQSKLASFVEANANVLSGFIVSLLVWMYIVQPLWGLDFRFHENLAITGIFTISSVARSYIWRRIFNHVHLKRRQNEVPKIAYGQPVPQRHPAGHRLH